MRTKRNSRRPSDLVLLPLIIIGDGKTRLRFNWEQNRLTKLVGNCEWKKCLTEISYRDSWLRRHEPNRFHSHQRSRGVIAGVEIKMCCTNKNHWAPLNMPLCVCVFFNMCWCMCTCSQLLEINFDNEIRVWSVLSYGSFMFFFSR